MTQDLLSLDVLVEMKKAAPKVTAVPFDLARVVVSELQVFADSEKPSTDENEVSYWQVRVRDLHTFCMFNENEISLNLLGRTLKAMGLETWHKMNGSHVAWSQAQLDILKRHFLK